MVNKPVPAEGWSSVLRSKYLYLKSRSRDDPPPQRGHVPNQRVFFNRYIELRGLLLALVHADGSKCRRGEKWKRVEMVMAGLRLQATTGQCFAGARFLGASGFGSEKTWDRTLSHLRSLGLVQTTRLVREDGRQSTNLTDFSALWALLLRLLAQRNLVLEQLSTGLWAKVDGYWTSLVDLIQEVFAPANTSAPTPQLPF